MELPGFNLVVQEVEGKGFAVFTSEAAKCNEVLLRDSPICPSSDAEEVIRALLARGTDGTPIHAALLDGEVPLCYQMRHCLWLPRESELPQWARDTGVSSEEFAEARAMLQSNGARIFCDKAAESTIYLLPKVRLLNHSCVPCAALKTNEGHTEWRVVATQELQAGEEVTISYISLDALSEDGDASASGKLRRAILKQRWDFECMCDRCQSEMRIADSVSDLSD